MNGLAIKTFSSTFDQLKLHVLKKLLLIFFLSPFYTNAQSGGKKLQMLVDSITLAANFPGLSTAIVYDNNTSAAFASGSADIALKKPMKTSDMMLQGSVGKTYLAALTMRLIKEGKIDLEEKVSKYLGDLPWYSRIPNAADITIKMLMTHTSGVMRYEFKESFTRDLSASPDKNWSPSELLQYILDEKASFKAGEGWEYSDTNYILLGMIVEKITGRKYYDLVSEKILRPLKLDQTRPSDSRMLKGLIQGYAGNDNPFGGKNEVIGADGKFIINPQFEWTGGGMYSTTNDLARWAKLMYEGKAFDSSMVTLMIESAVPAKLGRDTKYGLGVIIRNTPYGPAYGHSGFFPGYMTEMYYFPKQRVAIAVQINSSDFKQLKSSAYRSLLLIADAVLK